jgi:hydroxymethylglutaryl-CoA reductase
MVSGRASGKVILLGEHFVVHGTPAIAAAISSQCEVKLTKSEEISFIGPKGTSQELSKKSISNILTAMKIKEKFTVTYGGNLPIFGGLGSSAAFCVAIVRAVAELKKLKLSNEQINSYAYEGEKAFHGNPSGLDNTIATYGGAVLYTRGSAPNTDHFDPVKLGCDLHLVIGITGVFGPTSVMVSKVGEFKNKNPVVFAKLSDTARSVVGEGAIALEDANLERLGELMNVNHGLLSSLGVSTLDNEKIVYAMRKAGALGAKLTGGGGGGVCLALARDKAHAEAIVSEVKKAGYDALATEVLKKS